MSHTNFSIDIFQPVVNLSISSKSYFDKSFSRWKRRRRRQKKEKKKKKWELKIKYHLVSVGGWFSGWSLSFYFVGKFEY